MDIKVLNINNVVAPPNGEATIFVDSNSDHLSLKDQNGINNLIPFLSEIANTKIKIVKTPSDFPDNDILLGITYWIDGIIDIGDRGLIGSEGTVIFSLNPTHNKIISSSATKPIIKSVDGNLFCYNTFFESVNNTCIDSSSALQTNTLIVEGCEFNNSPTAILVDDTLKATIERNTFSGIDNCFLSTGLNGSLSFKNNICTGTVTSQISIESSFWDEVKIHENNFNTDLGGVAIVGDIDSLGITTKATLYNNFFSGAGDSLTGITNKNLKWDFQNNLDESDSLGLEDSKEFVEIKLDVPALTNITDGVYVKIEGITNLVEESRISSPINGIVQWDALETKVKGFKFIGALVKQGADRLYDFALFLTPLGGSAAIIPESELIGIDLNSKGFFVNVWAAVEIKTGDRVEVRIAGNGTSEDITLNRAVLSTYDS